jgi:hypothetical protein
VEGVIEDASAAYLRTRFTNSLTCVSIEGSRVGVSFPEYWYEVRMCVLILDLDSLQQPSSFVAHHGDRYRIQ